MPRYEERWIMAQAGEQRVDAPSLTGLHVLVAEDRGLIAIKVAQLLRQAGCNPVSPVATLKAGLDLARREDVALDAAVLDIDLRGESVWPLAEALRARGVPFVLLTGYGAPILPAPWRDVPRLEKPFEGAVLLIALRAAVAGQPPANSAPPDAFQETQPSQLVRRAWDTISETRNLFTETHVILEQGPLGRRR